MRRNARDFTGVHAGMLKKHLFVYMRPLLQYAHQHAGTASYPTRRGRDRRTSYSRADAGGDGADEGTEQGTVGACRSPLQNSQGAMLLSQSRLDSRFPTRGAAECTITTWTATLSSLVRRSLSRAATARKKVGVVKTWRPDDGPDEGPTPPMMKGPMMGRPYGVLRATSTYHVNRFCFKLHEQTCASRVVNANGRAQRGLTVDFRHSPLTLSPVSCSGRAGSQKRNSCLHACAAESSSCECNHNIDISRFNHNIDISQHTGY